jgi:hypothetical protein
VDIDLSVIASAISADVAGIRRNIAKCGCHWSAEEVAKHEANAAAGEIAIAELRRQDCTNEQALEALTKLCRVIVEGK